VGGAAGWPWVTKQGPATGRGKPMGWLLHGGGGKKKEGLGSIGLLVQGEEDRAVSGAKIADQRGGFVAAPAGQKKGRLPLVWERTRRPGERRPRRS